MERFAIKISDDLRTNLYNICRLCGIDYPTKIKILDSLKVPNDSDEESLSKKIECVVGIKVKRNDQMPQYICNLCADKINDFFEYREMCGATNIQTRKLLGIPLEAVKRKKNEKGIKVEGESILGLGILDGDITDSKLSIKQNSKSSKHRVKSRQKKKGNNSKKKVVFKDEEVKLESEEIKTETQSVRVNNKNNGKKLRVDLKKKVDPTPLLTLKEPNKRERRREIDAQQLERRRIREEQRREIEEKKKEIELAKQILEQKKLEKKRKTKNSDQEPPVKKMKQELDMGLTIRHSCSICSEAFSTNDLLTTHLHESHTVGMSTYGCSSCAESFKTINEEKDHELWHSLSKTSYICPICSVAFDKSSIFTRHITLCKPFNLTPTVSNIHCKECSGEYPTQNLYQWHDCFIKPNGRCWHCNRTFVKASSLFKHIFKCTSNQGAGESSISNIASGPSRDQTRNRKAKSYDRDAHIKSEPEANLDIDVPSSSNMLTADMLPVVVLTKSIFKPNQTVMVHDEQMPFIVKTENEIDLEDQSQLDDHSSQLDDHSSQLDEAFRDGDNSDDNIDESENVNGFPNAMDTTETFSDDDVIFIEDNQDLVVVNGSSPSTTRNLSDKPFVLPIIIKREPVDTTYEVVAPPMFDPNIRIKSEPLDGSGGACNEMEEISSPKRKSRKTKKTNTKSHKEREHLVRIKEEPTDSHDFSGDILRTVPTNNLGSAVVSLPTTNLLSATIKSEPIRPGYDDNFDPVLALNIKKEPGLEDSSQSRVPALRLRISKKHGTLNAKLISAREQTNTDDSPTSPKATKSKRDKEKRLYKKPALLAEKIRQEMIARMAREKENETTNQQNIDMGDFTVPIIARVVDGTTISDLPYGRVKSEPKSPCHMLQHTSNSPPPEQHELFSPFNRRYSIEDFENPQIDKDIWSFDDESTEPLKLTENIATDSLDNFLLEPNASNDVVGNSTIERNFTSDAGCNSTFEHNLTTDTVHNSTLEPSFTYDTAGSSTWEPNFMSETLQNSTLESNVTKDTTDNSTWEPTVTSDTLEHSTMQSNLLKDTAGVSTLEPVLAGVSTLEPVLEGVQTNGNVIGRLTDSTYPIIDSPIQPSENQQMNFDPIEETTPMHQQCDDLSVLENTYEIPDDQKATFEAIDEIINTLPLPNIEHIEKENLQMNINDEFTVVTDPSKSDADVLSSKDTVDESNSVLNSDNSESNSISDKINDSEQNAHCGTKLPTSDQLKSSEEFLLMNGDENVEMDLLKATVNENSDYELNAVQTLTTSAIHEQLHSLLEDISDDSLSCDIDLDDKTVDWEWESKLLGD